MILKDFVTQKKLQLEKYNEAERGFTIFYSIENKASFYKNKEK